MTDAPQVLTPYHRSEAFRSLPEAAAEAGRGVSTMRIWCEQHHLGRHIGGRWEVSRVALRMYLNGDKRALRLYLAGDRGEIVGAHYAALGLDAALQRIREELNRQNRQNLHGATDRVRTILAASEGIGNGDRS